MRVLPLLLRNVKVLNFFQNSYVIDRCENQQVFKDIMISCFKESAMCNLWTVVKEIRFQTVNIVEYGEIKDTLGIVVRKTFNTSLDFTVANH